MLTAFHKYNIRLVNSFHVLGPPVIAVKRFTHVLVKICVMENLELRNLH